MTLRPRKFRSHGRVRAGYDEPPAGGALQSAWAWRQRHTTHAGLITRAQGALPGVVRLSRTRTSVRHAPPGLPLFRARITGAARCSRPSRGPRSNDLCGGAVSRGTVFAVLAVVFDAVHPLCDQWLQRPRDAKRKGLHGGQLVYVSDGEPVAAAGPRPGAATAPASSVGRYATTAHVLTYGTGQIAASIAVLRALGFRVPWLGLASGTIINLSTHWILDRRVPLQWIAGRFNNKDDYIEHITVLRKPGAAADSSGPGSGLFELDSAAHRAFGVLAAAVTVLVATAGGHRGGSS